MHFSIIEKGAFAVLVTAWVVGGSNFIGNALVHAEPLKTAAYKVQGAAEAAPAETSAKAVETAAAGGGGGEALAMLATADAGAGAKTFRRCKACHSTAKGGKNKVGPNLWDVVGRAKAGVPGFKFSGALKGLGGEWTYKDLDAFLAKPKEFAKGTKMSFAGLKNPKHRANLLIYLRSLSDSPKPLP